MSRILTLSFACGIAILAQAQLAPQHPAPLAAHLLEVNAQWRTMDPVPAGGGAPTVFTDDTERIATHLRMVRERLVARLPEGLSATQLSNRLALLDRLAHYADEGRFPQNHVLPYRNPVFIDPYGTACAVGWLMIESGHRSLAENISAGMNLGYLHAIIADAQFQRPVAEWAMEHGFTADELAWIQPGYGPPVPWVPMGGGTDGPVHVLLDLGDDRLLLAGSFARAGNTGARNVAVWDGARYSALGAGVAGEVTCAAVFNGAIHLGGSFVGGLHDLAVWDGSAWTFGNVFSGMMPRIHALHVHGGALHAAGEVTGFAGTDHQVMRLGNGGWTPLGDSFNDAVLALATFNGELVAGGAFTQLVPNTGPVARHTARFDGTTWTRLGDGLDGTVRTFLNVGGTLCAGGDTYDADLTQKFGLARLEPGFLTWEPLLPDHTHMRPILSGNSPAENHVASLTMHGGRIIMGGSMHLAGTLVGVMGNHVGAFMGSPDQISPLAQLNGPVRAVARFQGRLVIGGDCSNLFFIGTTDYWSGIDDALAPLALGLSPNPVADRLSITLPDAIGTNPALRLMDMTGRTLEAPVERRGTALWLDTSALPAGSYLLETTGNGVIATGRFVKE